MILHHLKLIKKHNRYVFPRQNGYIPCLHFHKEGACAKGGRMREVERTCFHNSEKNYRVSSLSSGQRRIEDSFYHHFVLY